ncbi:hypothetical protein HDU97_000834 [Phlyctochytrium planicorne]|nr:hypothetical protein HDU97_000834 [Phlyctochytrium planicorne]
MARPGFASAIKDSLFSVLRVFTTDILPSLENDGRNSFFAAVFDLLRSRKEYGHTFSLYRELFANEGKVLCAYMDSKGFSSPSLSYSDLASTLEVFHDDVDAIKGINLLIKGIESGCDVHEKRRYVQLISRKLGQLKTCVGPELRFEIFLVMERFRSLQGSTLNELSENDEQSSFTMADAYYRLLKALVAITKSQSLQSAIASYHILQQHHAFLLENCNQISSRERQFLHSFSNSASADTAFINAKKVDIKLPRDFLNSELKTVDDWAKLTAIGVAETAGSNAFIASLVEVLGTSGRISFDVLPDLIGIVFDISEGQTRLKQLEDAISIFLTSFAAQKKECVQCILSSLDRLMARGFDLQGDGKIRVGRLSLDILPIARACLFCGAEKRSLLFLELSRMDINDDIVMTKNVLKKLDKDELLGLINVEDYTNSSHLSFLAYHESWIHVFNLSESLKSPNAGDEYNLEAARALSKLGYHNVLRDRLSVLSSQSSDLEMRDIYLESIWRGQKWSVHVDDCSTPNGFLLLSLATLLEKDNIESAEVYARSGLKLAVSWYDEPTLSEHLKGRMLPTASSFLGILDIIHSRYAGLDFDKLCLKWHKTSPISINQMGFSNFEMVLACRALLANWLMQKGHSNSQVVRQFALQNSLLYLREARRAKGFFLAHQALAFVKHLAPEDRSVGYQECKLLWALENKQGALKLLQRHIEWLRTADNLYLLSKHYSLLGKWYDAQKCANPTEILSIFSESVSVASKLDVSCRENALLVGKSSYALACYAYQHFKSLSQDESFSMLEDIVESPSTIDRFEAVKRDEKELRRQKKAALRNKMDQHDVETHKKSLLQSLLKYCDKWDLIIFRVCTLWFENYKVDEITALVRTEISKIPRRKFLVLIHQITARMETDRNTFQDLLQELILNIAVEYPNDTMYHLIALKNTKRNSSLPDAASQLLNRIKMRGLENFEKYDGLAEAYINLALLKPKKTGSGSKVELRGNVPIVIQDFSGLAVMTAPGYSDAVETTESIKSFNNFFHFVGGINSPKKIICLGQNGTNYAQLVKGGSDDLRQDAVLSKVFKVVNGLLQQSKSMSRSLYMRTYKVIPLGDQTGVIEWLENTTSLGDSIAKTHPKMFPNEISLLDARKRVIKEHESGGNSSVEAKFRTFCELETSLSPVLRIFFVQNFKGAACWYQARMSFTRTVATSSVVGWLMGLGDRHPQNILIDLNTGDFIHIGLCWFLSALNRIDFGVAFDSGKLLSIPEQIPFRLTRNIVDAFGALGVKGAFKIGSVETLDVIRASSDVLLAILEVLKFDPLYQWCTTSKGRSNPAMEARDGAQPNVDAKRAILGVQRKLMSNLGTDCQP